MSRRIMSLTPELVSRCHRDIEDPGPDPDASYLDDADYASMVEAMLTDNRAGQPLWIFAYGSLIWKPEIAHVEGRVATAAGWHRSFCLKLTRWRGTKEQPGLMMGLDRGGVCQGIAFRLPDGDARQQLGKLFRREMTAKPSTYSPRWLKVRTGNGPLRALGFVINRNGRAYSGPLTDAEVAQTLASACGHWGSGADYLYNAVHNLAQHSIHDSHLWRLQEMVAEAISKRV